MKLGMLGAIVAGLASTSSAAPPGLTRSIAAIQDYSRVRGGALWPGYDKADFSFLLIEGDRETLYCRSTRPDGFSADRRDPVLGCDAATRPRSQFPGNLLAAMPLFGPPSTIVMGTPEATGRTHAEWTRTILHEHFHQWQDALPDLYPRLAKLDLSGGDETGMWMLNFAFPYAKPRVTAAHAAASRALANAVRARGTPRFRGALARYLAARRAFAAAAGPRNWRYAEMQLWKEGVARWTEVRLGKGFPDSAVRESAVALEREGLAELDRPALGRAGREFVYAYGAGEAMLIEACDLTWRRRYPALLSMEPLLVRAARRCGVRP